MNENFKTNASGMSDPIQIAAVVTPSDSTDLPEVTRAIFVGTGGNLRVTLFSGDTVTFSNIGAGWHPLRVARVWATGTSAADIVGCL